MKKQYPQQRLQKLKTRNKTLNGAQITVYAQNQQGQGIIPNITIRNAHALGYAKREVTQLGSFSYVYTFCSMKERVGVPMVRRTRDFVHDPRKS